MAHPLSPLPYGASPLRYSRSSSPMMATGVQRWSAHTPNGHLDCEDHSFKMPSARRLQATKNRAHTAVATSTLQKQLESSLKHIRSRKSHLMLESISELQKKIRGKLSLCKGSLKKKPKEPPNIKSFIDSVTTTPLKKVELPLKDFVWEFDKSLKPGFSQTHQSNNH